MTKTPTKREIYRWEKIIKGAANHWRIEALFLVTQQPDLSTEDIVERLNINYQTGAHHVQKLVRAGLISTKRSGVSVLHKITPYGKNIINLLIKL